MLKRIFICTIILFSCFQAGAMSTLDSLLVMYDNEVEHSSFYLNAHQQRIDSLKHIRPRTKDVCLCIAREYQYFQSDSARVYYLPLLDAEEPYRSQAYMGLVQLSSSIGKYADGLILMDKVGKVPDSLRVDWIEAIWRIYSEMMLSTQMPQLQAFIKPKTDFYYDSLLHEMARQANYNEAIKLRHDILLARDAGNITQALAINEQILSRVPEYSHPYAIEAYNRAMLYDAQGKDMKRTEWLVRSAIADARCGITDNGSSWLVAQECYEAGDVNRAYRYSNYSLTNASFFNAPTRYIQTYALGHRIGSSYENRLRHYSTMLMVVLCVLAFMLVVVGIGVIYVVRQNHRLHVLNRNTKQLNCELRAFNRQLKELDKVKEQYICRYLEVYSDYIRRLTSMARKAGEKDPTTFMNREMDNFYRSFDDTFLSLYGTFVEDFNALLKPEARLTPKPGERMTIEMRIFALILLGISNSAKIAELLCYSPNTISNYRVKIKNAALGDREQFEHHVQLIGR